MHIYTYIIATFVILGIMGYVFLYILSLRIHKFEQKLIRIFVSRTDIFPALYEITKEDVARHHEIFTESLELRKKEFSFLGVSQNIEGFIELEGLLHHEINFIFQICNKNPSLLKEKRFLYIRDVMMSKSSQISREMKKYRQIIEIYNKIIKIKNYTVLGLLLPFSKKPVL